MPVGQHGVNHSTGRATRAGRGNNHGRAPRAIARALAAALLAAIPALAPPAGPAHAQAVPEDNPMVQRGVPAEATAENAVVARDRALASGQRIAYDRMAGQLGLPRGLSDSQIEAMVASLVIESERITPRGYSARITVNFNPQRVAGGRAPGGSAPLPGPGSGATVSPSGGPTVATLEAVARYRSFPEWVEITRRLGASPTVARAEVVTVSGEMARIRLALRSQPPDAAVELAQGGLMLGPAAMDARPGEGWRLGLAGSR
jgi:hypothetical protein